MLDRHNIYIEEKLQDIRFEELSRVAKNPCWLERLVGGILLPIGVAVVNTVRDTVSTREAATETMQPNAETSRRPMAS
jgi:hypothetical protein